LKLLLLLLVVVVLVLYLKNHQILYLLLVGNLNHGRRRGE
jgi:hypothetical protein